MRNAPKVDDPKGSRCRGAEAGKPAHLESLDGAAKLSDGVQGRVGEEEPELGFPGVRREELLRDEDHDHEAGSAAERGAGAVRDDERARMGSRPTADPGDPGTRRQLQVRVSVQDDRFITYLNGQVISSWSDKRLHRGGVGFFSEDDDPQKVDWVSLSERDSFLGKVLAHFSFFVMPGAQVE